MPGNLDQLNYARQLYDKYLAGESSAILVPPEALAGVVATLQVDSVPPRDVFAPVLAVVLSSLQVNAYRLFSQSTAFQPLLDLKAWEEQVPMVTDFKLLQILGEGYEGPGRQGAFLVAPAAVGVDVNATDVLPRVRRQRGRHGESELRKGVETCDA